VLVEHAHPEPPHVAVLQQRSVQSSASSQVPPGGHGHNPLHAEVAVQKFDSVNGRCLTTALFASVIAFAKNAPECAGVHAPSVSNDVYGATKMPRNDVVRLMGAAPAMPKRMLGLVVSRSATVPAHVKNVWS